MSFDDSIVVEKPRITSPEVLLPRQDVAACSRTVRDGEARCRHGDILRDVRKQEYVEIFWWRRGG